LTPNINFVGAMFASQNEEQGLRVLQ